MDQADLPLRKKNNTLNFCDKPSTSHSGQRQSKPCWHKLKMVTSERLPYSQNFFCLCQPR